MSIKNALKIDWEKVIPSLKLIIAISAISTASILIRVAQVNLSTIVIATWRLVISSIILLPIQFRKKIKETQKLNSFSFSIALLSGILLGLHFLSWIYSLSLTSVASSVVLVTTTPIWVALLSPFFLNESVNKKFILGLVISIIGIVLITYGPMLSNQDIFRLNPRSLVNIFNYASGNFFALLGAFSAAGYMIAGRFLREKLSTISYISLVYSIAAVFLVFISIYLHAPLFRVNISGAVLLLLIALIPQVVGHSLINAALGSLPAALVSTAIMGEPVGSTVLALIFLHEAPSAAEWVGFIVILVGIYFSAKSKD